MKLTKGSKYRVEQEHDLQAHDDGEIGSASHVITQNKGAEVKACGLVEVSKDVNLTQDQAKLMDLRTGCRTNGSTQKFDRVTEARKSVMNLLINHH